MSLVRSAQNPTADPWVSPERAPTESGLRVVTWATAAWLVATLIAILWHTNGRLTFTMDDPMIHFRLAEQISHGTYGINPGEAASVSSSVIWPLLFVPFARFGGVTWIAMGINMVATIVSFNLMYRVFVDVIGVSRAWRIVCVMLVLAVGVALRVGDIAFTGLEHSLQLALILSVVVGLSRLMRGDESPWLWKVTMILPLIRFESILITVVVAAVAWTLGLKRRAGWLIAVPLVALALFSGFLMLVGLGPVPNSVAVKASDGGANSVSMLAAVTVRWMHLTTNETSRQLIVLVGLCAALVAVALRRRVAQRTEAVWMVGAVGVFLVALSSQIGVARYLVAPSVFLVCSAVALLPHMVERQNATTLRRLMFGGLVVLIALALPGSRWDKIGSDAAGIYNQQYQLHRFVVEYLREPVAVNDLGEVSFHNPFRVVDLWGIGDQDNLHARLSGDPDWVDHQLDRSGVEVAIVYSGWFPSPFGGDWKHVGRLRTLRKGGAAELTVDFYVATSEAEDRVRSAMSHFVASNPEQTLLTMDI